jgi:hypothetical protein
MALETFIKKYNLKDVFTNRMKSHGTYWCYEFPNGARVSYRAGESGHNFILAPKGHTVTGYVIRACKALYDRGFYWDYTETEQIEFLLGQIDEHLPVRCL